jgi:hypothetical protein
MCYKNRTTPKATDSKLWDDALDVVGHEARKWLVVASLRLRGYTVETEVRLWDRGVLARADIMYQAPDGSDPCACGKWGIIDIKTAQQPDLSDNQQIVYRGFNVGSAFSDAKRITSFGYEPGQLLPAGNVWIMGPGKNLQRWPPFSFPPQ